MEQDNVRILIDPSAQEAERLEELGALDAVLYTHEHSDHFDAQLAKKLHQSGAKIFANQSTAKQLSDAPNVVSDGDEFAVKNIEIKALELPHCLMWDGSQGPQNTGYLIDGNFFHPGDGVHLAGLQVDNLALPITGPDISLKDAYSFARQLNAKVTVPIHYDYIGTKPEVLKNSAAKAGFELRILEVGQSTEL